MPHRENNLPHLRLLCLDVDGVLTDGSILIGDDGVETKRFHVRDGSGLRIWMALGHHVAIITGRRGMVVRHRCNELGIRHVIQGVPDKLRALEELADELGLGLDQVAVVGDDLPDLTMLQSSGYPVAVADAAREVCAVASYVTTAPGGRGAVREIIEHILSAQGRWKEGIRVFTGEA